MPGNKFNKKRPKYTPPARCHASPPGPPRWPGDYDVPKRPNLLANLLLPIGTTNSRRAESCQCWLYPAQLNPKQWEGTATASDGSTFLIIIVFNSPNKGARFDVLSKGVSQPFVVAGLSTNDVANQSAFVLRWTNLPRTNPAAPPSGVTLQVLS